MATRALCCSSSCGLEWHWTSRGSLKSRRRSAPIPPHVTCPPWWHRLRTSHARRAAKSRRWRCAKSSTADRSKMCVLLLLLMLGGVCSASDWAHSYITGQAHASRCLFPFAVSPADAKTLRLVHAWLWRVSVLSCWLLRRSTRWRTQRRCSTSQTDPSSRSQQPRSSRQRRAQQAGQRARRRGWLW